MEQLSPQQLQLCPVCGSPNLRTSSRQSLTVANDSEDLICGILGYRCENGHASISAGLHLQGSES
jgi:hypothetical protein